MYFAVARPLTHEILMMDVQKLAKVLALAASDNETEAVQALRTAKRLLDGHGADFVELARRLAEGVRVPHPEALPASLQEAAKEVAAAIRLRAELARMTEELEVARNERLRFRDLEVALHQQFREALAEAGRIGVELSDAESSRMRLEAENRRLVQANHALKSEIDALKASQPRAAAVDQTRHGLEENGPKRAPCAKSKAGASQYALL